MRCLLALALASALACAAAVTAAPSPGRFTAKELSQGYRDATVLAKPKAELASSTVDQAEQAEGMRLRARFDRFGGVRVLRLAAGESVKDAVARLKATGRYDYVEPDYIRHTATMPSDPDFPEQWGLNNTGSGGGIAGADIHAELGWSTRTSAAINGTPLIVGILDTGALTTHQDLAANMWVNPNPPSATSYPSVSSTNGQADTVTMTDSLNGLNAVAGTGLPTDDSSVGHGTHVSGIVGAVANNGFGGVGVAWTVQLMELEFIDSSDSGSTSDELPCIEYAIAHKVSVLNGSFGSQGFSEAEMAAIYAAGQAGIIFVCAAGNSSENADISGFFPADYPLDNIIAVGASDTRDLPAYFSNYGSGSVEIFAPGEDILSTINTSASSYGYLSGTSMSSPFVAGVVALTRAQYPGDTYRETINRILNSADTNPALAGKCQTGGRVDLAKALTTAPSTPPNALFANRTSLVGLDPYTRSNNVDSPAAPEAGTPTIAGTAGGHSLWWQWTAPESATVEIDTSGTNGGQYPGGSTYATLLGVYTGTSLGSLTPVASGATYKTEPAVGGGAATPYSEVSFHTVAGATYQINVQGQGGASGQTILAINTDPDNDSVSSPTVLSGRSVTLLDANPNATRQSGEPSILGATGGHSLWYAWTAPFTGPAQVSAYSYDFTIDAAVYTGTGFGNLSLVTSEKGAAASGTTTMASQVLCAFNATAGTTYLITVDGQSQDDLGEFTLSIDDARWQETTADAVTCSPAVGPDGTIYIGSNDNSFYAYNPDGSTKWTASGGSVFDTSSAAIGYDGTVYAGCTDGNVYAYTPAGAIKWTYAIPAVTGYDNGLSSSPALSPSGAILYIHADTGVLYALNSATGALVWTASVSGVSYAAPTVGPDGTVYIGDDSGTLYALNPANGVAKWSLSAPVAGEEIYTAAAIDAAGNLYFGTLSGNFYSVDPTGKLRWSFAFGDSTSSAPALANGAVYFGTYGGSLYSLSPATGKVIWQYSLGNQVRASGPAVDSNGVIYIGCYDHNVYAISSSGTLVRTYASDDVIRSAPAIGGTTLCFGSEDHKVYAFNIAASPASSDWPMYQYNAQRTGVAATSSLAITAQPVGQSIAVGAGLTLSAGASGTGPLAYQWSLNGVAIPGAVNSTYTILAATAANSGTYTVTVTSPSGSVTSAGAVVTVGTSTSGSGTGSTTGSLLALSARAAVGTGGNVLIAGFAINGSGSKTMLLRGIGPALGLAPFNLTGFLALPDLLVINTTAGANSQVANVTAWGGSTMLSTAFAEVGAFSLAANSADSAVLETLTAGTYTSEVSGVNATTGVALAEIYDTQPGSTSAGLVSISARANVGTGANILIAGFDIGGSQPAQVLLRGVGPSLALAPFSLAGVLTQPEIDLYNSSGTKIATNTGWGNSAQLISDFAQVGAFSLSTSADTAMVATLPPGAYTLQLSGQNGSTGIGLAEIYLLP